MPDISKMTPYDAYRYARDVLQRRWKEAEPVIMTSPYSAFLYARYVLKSRWEEAEPVIMTDPYYAYLYARHVLKSRWLEAEPVIKDSLCWDYYAKRFEIKEDKLSYLLSKRASLLLIINKINPTKVIHYRSLLCQLDEVECEILEASKAPRPSRFTEWFESVFIPKYLRAFRWLVLGLSCLVGVGYVLN